jgi:hypothetical protein
VTPGIYVNSIVQVVGSGAGTNPKAA